MTNIQPNKQPTNQTKKHGNKHTTMHKVRVYTKHIRETKHAAYRWNMKKFFQKKCLKKFKFKLLHTARTTTAPATATTVNAKTATAVTPATKSTT